MTDLIELTDKQRIEVGRQLTRHLDSRPHQRAPTLLLDNGQSMEEIAVTLSVSRQTAKERPQ